MVKEISFIHAADLHLDSPFKGLAQTPESIFKDIRDSTFRTLDHLVETAIEKHVDFVLLVGDLFDNDVQSLKAQVRLRDAFEKLNNHDISVYISYGNHDYRKGNIHSVTYPENVHVFQNETVTHFTYYKNGERIVNIYGFSYERRSITEKKVTEYMVTDETIPFHIAMLHGSLQSNTTHDTYAPFQLQELVDKPFDYWALGHIHQRDVLKMDPPVIYSGNTQGRHRLENGEKGCYHVTLSEAQPQINFVPLQAIEFYNMTIQTDAMTDVYALEKYIQTAIQQLDHTVPLLIHITFIGSHDRLLKWEKQNDLTECIELVNEWGIKQPYWRYVFKYYVNMQSMIDDEHILGDPFVQELLQQFDTQTMTDYTDPLFNHRQARRYLEHLSRTEIKAIQKDARQLLLQELRREGGGEN